MIVWRNSEGREFPVIVDCPLCAEVEGGAVAQHHMLALGYELVEKEPVSFEIGAVYHGQLNAIIVSPSLVVGQKYRVTEVES